MTAENGIKLVILGDGGVGKTSFLITYVTGSFPEEYTPYVQDFNIHDVTVDGKPYSLCLFDTGGGEDYHRLRPLCYPQTDIFLLCYCVERRCSFNNIAESWIPEIRHHMGNEVPILLAALKKDLCGEPGSENGEDGITYQEGKDLADSLKLPFCEVSSIRQEGISECMDCALRMALRKIHWERANNKKGIFGLFSRRKVTRPPFYPPLLPPPSKAPRVEVETSLFYEHWQHLLEEPRHADVEFLVEGRYKVQAHKVVLAAASEFFRKVFGLNKSTRHKQNGIDNVFGAKDQGSIQTFIELSADITVEAFKKALEFIYTGTPDLPKDASKEELQKLRYVAQIFQLSFLETICTNIEKDDPSIGTYLNSETGRMMKHLFFNQESLSDVVFDVQGTKFHAHKVILSARCEVLSAMFGGNFAEGQPEEDKSQVQILHTTPDIFLALLEYLYTDHAPIEEGNSLGIMVLADRFCQTRLLNLCELYITKQVDRSCSKNIAKADIDVVGLLHCAQAHNATQLEKWCLHFIATNYEDFQKRPEFSSLTGKNLEYVTENQWPPLSYLKELEEYEKACKAAKEGQEESEEYEKENKSTEKRQKNVGEFEKECTKKGSKCIVM